MLWKALKKLNATGKSEATEAILDENANSFNNHFVSIASPIIQGIQTADIDLSYIKIFVDKRKTNSVNFKIPFLDAILLNELIVSPTNNNISTGLDGLKNP